VLKRIVTANYRKSEQQPECCQNHENAFWLYNSLIVTRQKIGRNDPCWCGSGKKYKKCHANRTDEKPLAYHELAEGLIGLRTGEKRCLYPPNPKPCLNSVIRAHSISRNAALRQIAVGGKVYQGNANPYQISKTGGQIKHSLVGINLATTFTGFCSQHDNALFQPIDEGNLVPTNEQTFLLHFRALCRELYVKRPTLMTNELLRNLDRGKSEQVQQLVQSFVSARSLMIEDSITKLEADKLICDQMILSKTYNDIRGYVLRFKEIPTIACSGLTQPIYDFAGNTIQDIRDISKPLHNLSFTLLPNITGGIAVFAWLKDADPICRSFISSLIQIPENRKSDALTQLVFDSFENHAVQPTWLDNLPDEFKGELEERMLNWSDARPWDSRALIVGSKNFANWKFESGNWI
jgi:hypothetical protein